MSRAIGLGLLSLLLLGSNHAVAQQDCRVEGTYYCASDNCNPRRGRTTVRSVALGYELSNERGNTTFMHRSLAPFICPSAYEVWPGTGWEFGCATPNQSCTQLKF